MEKIYEILEDIRPESDFKNSSNFIDDYLLDSFDIYSLISEFEEKFNVTIEPDSIVPENFVNVDSIIKLLSECGVEQL